ncbi:uncharacterized protein KY384_003296 [Bacidia gigantensis]|uniref:uncharacterized protein n=1 Tax=Bacidia gigantensis TaxID=2732470 RepID=UPI001D03D44B|nr:uncharacterized protein KY384_003296 [Bacidia gigantensis]KAG8531665.1 hypothetical protein KY384_003296 [Bacidia gigantensis]
MASKDIFSDLDPLISDADEETFILFSQNLPSQNLGFIDSKAYSLDLTVAGKDLTISQSPGLLSSTRKDGTTGAVLWKVTHLFAEWIASKGNFLFKRGFANTKSTVIELGCGISGLIPLVLAPKVGRFIATDQEYVFKLLRQNLEVNSPNNGNVRYARGAKRPAGSKLKDSANNIEVLALDWQGNSASSLSSFLPNESGVDLIVACDCIYNEELIPPFVDTCVDICRIRQRSKDRDTPTVIAVAQQLRSDRVFGAWLSAFMKHFDVCKVPDDFEGNPLWSSEGFTLHIAVLKRFEIECGAITAG